MGQPKRVLSDHGSQFTSPKWGDSLRKAGVKVLFSSVRHPQSNPVEKVMRELGRLFRTLCSDKHTRWVKYVKDIEFFLNVTTHMSTGYSPFELHFGQKARDQVMEIISFPDSAPLSKDAKIMLAEERLRESFEQRSKSQKTISKVSFNVGDLVLLHIPRQSDAFKKLTRKFFHIYFGPYVISNDFGNNAYELADRDCNNRIIGVYNQVHLKKYIKRIDV